MAVHEIPRLEGEARAAVDYRGGNLQIIASAGSSKTEVLSQRVAGLLADGVPASAIVAFTFTERVAASLKARIERCILAHPKLGHATLDRVGGMFVGTIHSYCFRILQQHVPKYETYDVLDDHRLTAFLTREYNRIGIKQLDGQLFKSIRTFLDNLDVVENELLEPQQLEDPSARSTRAISPFSKSPWLLWIVSACTVSTRFGVRPPRCSGVSMGSGSLPASRSQFDSGA